MYTLKRDNVVKLTDSTEKRDRYISEGYKLVEKPVAVTETPPAGDGRPAETPPASDNKKEKGKNDK